MEPPEINISIDLLEQYGGRHPSTALSVAKVLGR
jgi:hypothetical protein